MAEKNLIRLVIVSDSIDPDELERKIGMTADKRWAKGDLRSHTTIREQMSGWMITAETNASVAMDVAIEKLLTRITPVFERISELQGCSKQLSVVAYCAQPPALNFAAVTIAKVAKLGASLDVDLYFVEEPTLTSNARPEPTKE